MSQPQQQPTILVSSSETSIFTPSNLSLADNQTQNSIPHLESTPMHLSESDDLTHAVSGQTIDHNAMHSPVELSQNVSQSLVNIATDTDTPMNESTMADSQINYATSNNNMPVHLATQQESYSIQQLESQELQNHIATSDETCTLNPVDLSNKVSTSELANLMVQVSEQQPNS